MYNCDICGNLTKRNTDCCGDKYICTTCSIKDRMLHNMDKNYRCPYCRQIILKNTITNGEYLILLVIALIMGIIFAL